MTRRTPDQYDWAKQEFDERLLTKHFTRGRRSKIGFVVVHHSTIVGKGDGRANATMYAVWQEREASAHYGVDGDYVCQFVWDRDAAWATGNSNGNHAGISIEHANATAAPKWTISEKTWKNGARLAGLLHVTHKLGRPVSGKTLRKHSSFTSTACPGPYMDSIWAKYVAEAQRVYDEATKPTPTTPAPSKPTEKPITGTTYTVVKGDTLASIARRAGKSVAELTAWNKLKDPARIEVGQKLVLTKPKPTVAPFRVMSWNLKSPTLTAPISWAIRRGRQVAEIARQQPSVLLLQEAGSPKHVKWYDAALRKALDLVNARAVDSKGSGKWRAIYYDPAVWERVTAGLYNLPASTLYKGDQKPMVWAVLRHRQTGDRWLFSSFHLENDAAADHHRVAQALAVAEHLKKLAASYDVGTGRTVAGGDTNSNSWVRDRVHAATSLRDAFDLAQKTAGESWASHNAWKDARKGARIDLILTDARTVLAASQASTPKAADHNPQSAYIQP